MTDYNASLYGIRVRKTSPPEDHGMTYFVATIDELPGVKNYGCSFKEAYILALSSIETLNEMYVEKRRPFPQPGHVPPSLMWTPIRPTESGHYWLQTERTARPRVVKVIKADGLLYYAGSGRKYYLSGPPEFSDALVQLPHAIWAGPIPVPTEYQMPIEPIGR